MRRGFTLFEMLVVVTIAIMISGFAIGYGRSVQRQLDLYVEVQKVAELVLRAKALAVSTYSDPNIPANPGFERCGYGISIYGGWRYRMFLYRVPAMGPEQCGNLQNLRRNSSTVVTIPGFDIGLNQGVIFGRAGGRILAGDLCEVLFLPPEPKIKTVVHGQNGANCGPSGPTTAPFSNPTASGKIRLLTQDRSSAMTITVGAAGQVDF